MDVNLDVAVVQVAGSVNVAGVGFQQVGMMCGLKPNPRRATPRKRVRARVVRLLKYAKLWENFQNLEGGARALELEAAHTCLELWE